MRVKISKAPGYADEWHAELITYARSVDGRPIAVVESEGGEWHVIPSAYVREPRDAYGPDPIRLANDPQYRSRFYDACGCIAPCPDHKSPSQDGQRDRDHWNDRYADDTE